ncbi:elongation factor Ts, mitochondrial isoform X2 [Physcomitrium patens]|uniref:elongation factor Ts, mitochondrial isoform X2 n=1 Tax=Physcomitrium patens TaxID=3218 RepID=UPI003CCD6A1C
MPCAALGRKSFHRHPAMQWFSMLSREWGVVGAARDWSLFRRGFTSESAVQIKVLQERTEAPVGDVKAALLQCGWDTDAAMMELTKKGLIPATRKTNPVALDGLLAVASMKGAAAVIEINSETNSVARNEIFCHLASRIAQAALSMETLKSSPGSALTVDVPALQAVKINLEHEKLSGEATVQEAVTEVAAIIGENVQLRRGFLMSSTTGIVSSYLHASAHPDHGILQGQEPEAQIGTALAMHVVAAKPLFLSRELVPQTVIRRETIAFRSQALISGKKPAVVERMVLGRFRRYFEETVLLDQKFVINDYINVQTVLDDHHKQTGRRIKIRNFLRLEVGEGL